MGRFVMKTFARSAFALLVLFAAPCVVNAQTVDIAEFTCKDLMAGPGNDAVFTSVWLSGFYNGKHNNTKIDLKKFKDNADAVVKYCTANPTKTVVQAVDSLLASQK